MGFSAKFGALSACVILLSALAVGGYFAQLSAQLSEERLEEMVYFVARDIATESVQGVSNENLFKTLDRHLSYLQANQDLIFGAIYNREGKVLAHTDSSRVGLSDRAVVESYAAGSTGVWKKAGKNKYFEVILPIQSPVPDLEEDPAVIGFVRIQGSYARLQGALYRMLLASFAWTLGILLVALIAGAFISWKLTTPLRRIVEANEAAARGDAAGADIPESEMPEDEIGNIMRSRARMQLSLRREEASRMKIQKLESLGVLAGGIAHDFNNLLTGIIGNLSLLEYSSDLEGENREIIEETLKVSRETQGLTQQLLTFAKGGTPKKEVFAPGEVIRKAAAFVSRGSSSRCRLELAKDLLPINADKGQISQVIHNLIINAFQAMAQGATVILRAENVVLGQSNRNALLPGEYVRISVEDAGTGIPEGLIDKIFDPYFSTKASGRGLGLATCRSIIEKHGGTMGVESTVGKGSVFTLELPASREKEVKTKQKTIKTACRKGRVLIMDDEPMIARILGRMLKKLGCESTCVPDGARALEEYQKSVEAGQPFDAVVMDLTIPGAMGGVETIGRLLKLAPEAKAIVSSGYSNEMAFDDYRAKGFVSVLPKPYELDQVSRVMREVLGSA